MSEKILIVQHVLPKYEFDSSGNRMFDKGELVPAIVEWIERCEPDRVIVTKENPDDELFPELEKVATDIQEWRWVNVITDEEAAAASELGVAQEDVKYVWANNDFFCPLLPWMKALPKDGSIMLMGGHVNECLKGLAESLDELDIDYEIHQTRVWPL